MLLITLKEKEKKKGIKKMKFCHPTLFEKINSHRKMFRGKKIESSENFISVVSSKFVVQSS